MDEEKNLREEICRIGKLLYDKGLIAGTQGNISCCTDRGDILITPAGRCKGMLIPEEIVMISPAGKIVELGKAPSTEFRIHLAGYQHRPEFRAAVHAHPVYATAFSLGGLKLTSEGLREFDQVFGEIPLVSYGESGTKKLASNLAKVLNRHHTYLLEAHGIIAFGANLLEAFFRVEMAEQMAKTIAICRKLLEETPIEEDDLWDDPEDPELKSEIERALDQVRRGPEK